MNTHRAVGKLLDPPGGRPVLDVGAGVGNFTAYLGSHGYQAVALDLDPHDYRDAGYCDAPFVLADFDVGLPVAAGAADGAVAIEVLEHLESPLRTLRQMADAVAVGGFVIVTTPNVMSWVSRAKFVLRGHLEGFDDGWYGGNGHISPVPRPQLQRMADRLNLFTEVVTYNVARPPLPKLHYAVASPRRKLLIEALGESLIVKFRKLGPPLASYQRG